MRKSQDFRMFSSVLVLRQGRKTPLDADWDACMESIASRPADAPPLRVLVITDGGGPSVEQRRRLSNVLDGKPVKIAVVSESSTVRFIVSSVALFNQDIASFRPSEIGKAYSYLGLGPDEIRSATRAIDTMSLDVA